MRRSTTAVETDDDDVDNTPVEVPEYLLNLTLEQVRRLSKPITYPYRVRGVHGIISRKKEHDCDISIDSGCPISIIHPKEVKRLALTTKTEKKPFIGYTFADQIALDTTVMMKIHYPDEPESAAVVVKFWVSDRVPWPVLGGRDFMKALDLELKRVSKSHEYEHLASDPSPDDDYLEEEFRDDVSLMVDERRYDRTAVNRGGLTRQLLAMEEGLSEQMLPEPEPPSVEEMNKKGQLQFHADIDAIEDPYIRDSLKALLKQYKHLEPRDEADFGLFPDIQMEINLNPDHIPPKARKPIPLSKVQHDAMRTIIDKFLKAGVMRRCDGSPYATQVFLVPKKRPGEFRFIANFIPLNKVTVRDRWPLPVIGDMLKRLSGNRYFSKLDLKGGFYHVEIKEEDKHKAAIITPFGQFEYCRMAMGLTNSPAVFQRAMQRVFGDIPDVDIYLDDLLISSPTAEAHLKTIEKIFERASEYNCRFVLWKCEFFRRELEYFGHLINEDGVGPSPKYIKKVLKIERPTSKNGLMQITGAMQWLAKFDMRIGAYLVPFSDMLKKGVHFQWTDALEDAWTKIRELVKDLKWIYHPDQMKAFVIYTDASDRALGACLMQLQGDRYVPIEYLSKKFTPAERKWPTCEQELFALVVAIRK
jgi:hypothetical protein